MSRTAGRTGRPALGANARDAPTLTSHWSGRSSAKGDIRTAVEKVKAEASTAHVPVIVFAADSEPALLTEARKAGANFTIADAGIAAHLAQLVDQALDIQ